MITRPTPALDAQLALRDLLTSGARPRVVWHGGDVAPGEFLELSGRVVATWASKIANLLHEEVDAGPGTRVVLDLPVHWRSLTWSLGTWLTGASIALPGRDDHDPEAWLGALEPDDVVVTHREPVAAAAWAAGVGAVALVPLASFALRWPGTLPAGVLDGAADVAAQPDVVVGPLAPLRIEDLALTTAQGTWTFAAAAGPQPAVDLLAAVLVVGVLSLAGGEVVELRG